jgi:hypothetical protein
VRDLHAGAAPVRLTLEILVHDQADEEDLLAVTRSVDRMLRNHRPHATSTGTGIVHDWGWVGIDPATITETSEPREENR